MSAVRGLRVLVDSRDPSLYERVAAIARPLGCAVERGGPGLSRSADQGAGFDLVFDGNLPHPANQDIERALAAAEGPRAADLLKDEVWQSLVGLDGTGELSKELVEMFREDGLARLDALRRAVARSDREAACRTAHSLRGSAGNLGAFRLARICAVIESEAPVADISTLDALVAAATALFARSLDALTSPRRDR